jgi:hypothetical protein
MKLQYIYATLNTGPRGSRTVASDVHSQYEEVLQMLIRFEFAVILIDS